MTRHRARWGVVVVGLVASMGCEQCCTPPAAPDAGIADAARVADAKRPAPDAAIALRRGGGGTPPDITHRLVAAEDPGESLGRACASDLFSVDLLASYAWDPGYQVAIEGARDQLAARLNPAAIGAARTNRAAWFGHPAPCGEDPVEVRLAGVFDGQESALGIEPGRHQILTFQCPGSARRLPVVAAAQCDVVDQFQGALVQSVPPTGIGEAIPVGAASEIKRQVMFARDCDGVPQGDAFWYSDPAWLGAFPSPPTPTASAILAVIDTPRDASRPRHADRVHAVIQQVLGSMAAQIEVAHVPALVYEKGTPSTYIAREIGALAVQYRADERPMVANLSFGWPDEFGQIAELRGSVQLFRPAGNCRVAEGPSGEAVRSALVRLRGRKGQALLFAARGNRYQRQSVVDTQGAPTCLDVPLDTDANGAPRPGTPMGLTRGSGSFFPAAWATILTCVPGAAPRHLAISVGVDTAGGPLSGPDTQLGATLLAPGANLGVDDAGTLGTGTSYAAAVASAAAARLLLSTPTMTAEQFLQNHTCAAADATPRLRVGGGCDFPVLAPLSPPPAPCTDCLQPVDAGGVSTLQIADAFATGLATPQPDDPPCPVSPCRVVVQSGLAKFDFTAAITDGIHPAATYPYIKDVKLVIIDGTTRHEYTLPPPSGGWAGATSYPFTNIALPSALAGNPAKINAALYRFECKHVGTAGVVLRSDPVSLETPP